MPEFWLVINVSGVLGAWNLLYFYVWFLHQTHRYLLHLIFEIYMFHIKLFQLKL
jgi:hypothetical protein